VSTLDSDFHHGLFSRLVSPRTACGVTAGLLLAHAALTVAAVNLYASSANLTAALNIGLLKAGTDNPLETELLVLAAATARDGPSQPCDPHPRCPHPARRGVRAGGLATVGGMRWTALRMSTRLRIPTLSSSVSSTGSKQRSLDAHGTG
jgi:hypothetical protein